MTENEAKRLQNIREKIAKMKKQEQTIVSLAKLKERKQRTRRLIQNGALAEKYLQCENMDPTEFEKILKKTADTLNIINDKDL